MRGISSGKPFRANYTGRCAVCSERYAVNEWIYSQGKGNGAIHKRCMARAGLVVRQMTDEERQRVGK